MSHKFPQSIARFANDATASVVPLFGLLILCLLASAGVALDFAGAYGAKAKFDSAADAALIAALKTAKDAALTGDSHWKTTGEAAGHQIFHTAHPSGLETTRPAINIDIKRRDNEFTGTLEYAAVYKTKIMQIFNKREVALTNAMSASYSIPNYLDVHFLIDVSPSMGIGATLNDQRKMYDAHSYNGGTGCALACHYMQDNGADPAAPPPTTLQVARGLNATLRLDVVKEAVRSFIQDVKHRQKDGDQVRISIDLFSNRIIPLFAASTDLDAAHAAAANIELTNLFNNAGTNIAYPLGQLALSLAPSGDGFAPDKRKSFVVLMSDGVENLRYKVPPMVPEHHFWTNVLDENAVASAPAGGPAWEPLQTIGAGACDGIKAGGHTMMTAEIEYLIPPPEYIDPSHTDAKSRFAFIESTLKPVIPERFKSCASEPAMAYLAGASSEIEPMLEKILDTILAPSQLRLTQ